jgi:predicted negative regulator of RcsB-dependent stress response
MARKKRRVLAQFQPPEKEDEGPKKVYQDEFQSTVGKKIKNFADQFEGKSKTITYALAAVAVLILIGGIFYVWNKRSINEAQTALGKAIEVSQRTISDTPQPAGSTVKTFKTQNERAEASIAEFQAVADKFGGAVGEKAKYFVAVNRLVTDRPTAINELTELAKASGEVGMLSKFALAQTSSDDGKFDEAAALYQELVALDNPVIAKDTLNIALAKIYEKQKKVNEATDIYYNIAKAASEAKDADGNPVPMSSTARDAKAKVEELNPERAKEIVEPPPTMPGGMPMGM